MLRVLRLFDRKVGLIPLMVLSILAVGGWPGTGASARLSLVVEAESGGKRYLCLPVSPGEVFQIEFLHSYDRFPFKEYYRVEGPGEIRLFRLVFRSILNGQGFVYPGVRIRPDGWGEIDGIEAYHPFVEFLMGAREHANHRLTLRGMEYSLADVIPPGTPVVVRVQTASCNEPVSMDKGDPYEAR